MHRYRAFALAFVVLVVFLGSAFVLFTQPAYLERFRDAFSKHPSGLFVFQTSVGSVAILDSEGEVHELLSDASAKPLIAHEVIAPDRSRGAALRFSPNVLEVVSFTLGASPELQVLSTHDAVGGNFGERVSYPVWAPDSRTLAYRFSPAIAETALAELVGPQGGFDPLGGVAVSSEAVVPEAYLPRIHVVAHSQPGEQVGTGTPLAFSPDGRSLLVEDRSQLYLVALKTGERTQVSGGPRVEPSGRIPLQLRLIPGSSHVLAWAPTERIEVYVVDWEQGTLARLGELPNGEFAQDVVVDASTGTRALVVVSDGEKRRAVEYRLGTRVTQGRSFDLALPSDARLLQWFSE